MKKSTIAFSIIALLGGTWSGSTWYTGSRAEQEYHRQIAEFNRQYQTLGLAKTLKLEYQNVKFERHFFSSDIVDELRLTDQRSGKTFTLPLSATLYHGPLPLNHLSRFNLAPAMFSFEGKIDKNADTALLFDLTKSDKFLTFNISADYRGKTQGNLELAAIKWQQNGNALDISPVILTFNNDSNKHIEGKFSLRADHFIVDAMNNDAKGAVRLEYKNLQTDGNIRSTAWLYLPEGESKAKIDQINIQIAQKGKAPDNIELNGLSSNAENRLDQHFFNQRGDYKIDNIRINGKSYGKFNYDSELNHIDAHSLNAIYEEFVNLLKQGDVTFNKQQLEKNITHAFLTILNNQPQLKISKFELDNEKGKLHSDLNIALASNPDFNFMGGSSLLKQFTAFNINVDLSKEAAADILEKLLPPEQKNGVDIPAEIEKIAQQSEEQGIFVNHEKNVTLNLVLENGELKLNGNVIPEEQVNTLLWMLALGKMR